MSNRGSITLGEPVGKLDLLEINCHRCDRQGRVSLGRLISEHGADTGLPDCGKASQAIASMRGRRRCKPLCDLSFATAGAIPAELTCEAAPQHGSRRGPLHLLLPVANLL